MRFSNSGMHASATRWGKGFSDPTGGIYGAFKDPLVWLIKSRSAVRGSGVNYCRERSAHGPDLFIIHCRSVLEYRFDSIRCDYGQLARDLTGLSSDVLRSLLVTSSEDCSRYCKLKGCMYCIALYGNLSQGYGASPAIWYHTVLRVTLHRWSVPPYQCTYTLHIYLLYFVWLFNAFIHKQRTINASTLVSNSVCCSRGMHRHNGNNVQDAACCSRVCVRAWWMSTQSWCMTALTNLLRQQADYDCSEQDYRHWRHGQSNVIELNWTDMVSFLTDWPRTSSNAK